MTLIELLSRLDELGIELWVEEGELYYETLQGDLPDSLLQDISNNKPKILDFFKETDEEENLSSLPIKPVPREADLPLSFAQQRLWFLDQLEPDNAFYNIPIAVCLDGPLNVFALHQTFGALVARHESLRTRFITQDGEPIQLIDPIRSIDHSGHPAERTTSVPMPIVDLQALPTAMVEQHAKSLTQQEAQLPFSLSKDPLIRIQVLRLGDNEHYVLLTLHHIVSDGWSMGVLVDEVATLYAAFCEDRPSPLPPLPIQYADFAHWQRQWLQGDVLNQQLGYWKTQLTGIPELLELPTDRPRPPVQTYAGDLYTFELDSTLTEQLNTLSRQQGTTLFMTLLAALSVLLSRYAHQADICIGSPIANRTQAELEGLIGFFVNTLVLRTDLSDNPSFSALLQQAKETTLNAYAHQDIPFEQLVDELNVNRDMSHSPLFQVMMVLQNAPKGTIDTADLKIRPVQSNQTASKFDLSFDFIEAGDQLVGSLEYNTDLFDASTIQRLSTHLIRLLEQVVKTPELPISEVDLLSEAERHQLLVEWNDTQADYPQDHCIHHLFEQQVDQSPDRIALVFEDQTLSYQQLNNQANQLAHYLIQQGIGPDVLVGLCIERSLDMVISLLAILKAGGAYVPIDPEYPPSRIQYMIDDAKAPVMITHSALLNTLPQTDTQIICIDLLNDLIQNTFGEEDQDETNHIICNPNVRIDTRNTAYVIYTSGSTGRPKGVMMPHIGITNLALSIKAITHSRINTNSKISLNAAISFDASTQQWTQLLYGCTIYLIPEILRRYPKELLTFLNKYSVEELDCTPTHLQSLLPFCSNILKLPNVLLVAGESISDSLWQALAQSSSFVINLYGPTECCVDSTAIPVSYNQTSSIGYPITNTQCYILDWNHDVVPLGVSGELYIGGVGLARGYLNRPDLTAEKFIPNPFRDTGERLYRTGDLARYLPDGNIEYLGRIDHQVKIRGFRIELGEIEARLLEHPSINESVVIARQDNNDDKRLAAYLIPTIDGDGQNNGESLSAQTAKTTTIPIDELRVFLKHTLPDYMIPSAFVIMDAFPLTPNGKLDRKALPVPDQPLVSNEYIAPRNPTEQLLADIWKDVLKLDQVGIYDNFFELGGHSLLATQVISQIRHTFEIELPLRYLFEAPSVSELTLRVNQAQQEEQGLIAPPITVVSRDEDLPLSFAQQRLWFLDQLEPDSTSYNITSAVKITGNFNTKYFHTAINMFVARHEILRTSYPSHDGQPQLRIEPTLNVTLPAIDLQSLPKETQLITSKHVISNIAQNPCDLENGPLIQTNTLRLSDSQYILVIKIHHIVFDGWSMNIMIDELFNSYIAIESNSTYKSPNIQIQYVDYAHWQKNWLEGTLLEQQLSYWNKQLDNAPELLTLPIDFPRPAIQTDHGDTYTINLSHRHIKSLKAICRQNDATIFMGLLAIFNMMLARYSGQNDICVGTPVSNRNHHELEKLVGFFVNTLTIRTKIHNVKSFEDLLLLTKRTVLDALSNQDLPFEHLVETLNIPRNLSYMPLFQVMFTLHTQQKHKVNTQVPQLELTPIDVEHKTAKFDLSLDIYESVEFMKCAFEFNTNVFCRSTIERMANHFALLIKQIPTNNILTFSLTTKEELQIIKQSNSTLTDVPYFAGIHSVIENQIRKQPDAIAITDNDCYFTYSFLDRNSANLSNHLIEHHVAEDKLVGVCLERSINSIIAILSIWKAGGAFVPLQPDLPVERLNYMIADAQVELVVCDTQSKSSLPASSKSILDIDKCIAIPKPTPNSKTPISRDNLAYMIYTSGSTGRPKGSMISHRNLINTALAYGEPYKLLEGSSTHLQMASMSFDVFTGDLVRSLCFGGNLIFCPREILLDSEKLYSMMTNLRTNVAEFVPAVLRNLIQHLEQNGGSLEFMKTLICSGEGWPMSEYARCRDLCGKKTKLINSYGLTEVAIDSLYLPSLKPNFERQRNIVPIGKKLANNKAYVVDSLLNLSPIGVKGELLLGGMSVGRGFLNQPALTSERFIPNPFDQEAGGRLYRTGDLASYDEDGIVSIFDRIDNQVKLRGFRIELGEIESCLLMQPDVNQCVVVEREDEPGKKIIAAYFVSVNPSEVVDTDNIKANLKSTLPAYMIPSVFIHVNAIPLTPTGKLDRKALPEPKIASANKNTVPPRNPTESVISDIFKSILNLEKISIHDDFLGLGGHSLLAVKCISKIEKKLGARLPLSTLFRDGTVEKLAKQVEKLPQHDTRNSLVPIQIGGTNVPLFLVHPIGGNVFCYNKLAHLLGKNQPVFGLQSRELSQDDITNNTVQEMAKHYLDLIIQLNPTGPYYLGGWSDGGIIAFEMIRQLEKHGHTNSHLILIDSSAPYSCPSDDKLINYAQDFLLDLNLISGRADVSIPALNNLAQYNNVEKFFEAAMSKGALPYGISAKEARLLFEVFYSNSLAVSKYRTNYVLASATIFITQESRSKVKNWAKYISRNLKIIDISGGHYTLLNSPYVQENTTKLSKHLKEIKNAQTSAKHY